MNTRRVAMIAVSGLALGLLILWGLLHTPEAQALKTPPRAAPALEYLAVKSGLDLATREHLTQFNAELNALGQAGWELVATHPVLIFKRPK